jgi:superfamily II DNA or RNA helicase
MALLLYDPAYQHLVATIAKGYQAAGHKVLIPADRVEFLDKLGELLGESCAVVHGQVEVDREQVFDKMESEYNYLAGNRSIFSEGISIPVMSCAILAQPSGNAIMLEQLTARINRMHPSKETKIPVIVDLQFKGPTASRQNRDRLAFYTSQGWKIKYV